MEIRKEQANPVSEYTIDLREAFFSVKLEYLNKEKTVCSVSIGTEGTAVTLWIAKLRGEQESIEEFEERIVKETADYMWTGNEEVGNYFTAMLDAIETMKRSVGRGQDEEPID